MASATPRRLHDKLTVIVSGMIAATPYQAGATWTVLHYVLGLQELGHDVYFVEPVPQAALQPAGAPLAASVNARYFHDVMAQFGLTGRATLLLEGSQTTVGMPYPDILAVAQGADLLINSAGLLRDEGLCERIPVRAYLDLDPAFTQLWQTQGVDMRFAGHTHFVTIGLALGQPGCPVPDCGLDWITTVQPLVLSHWPVATTVTRAALTSIANWRSYGSLEVDGVFYGQKAHSLRRFMALPREVPVRFELALAIHPEERNDLAALRSHGWCLLDPSEVVPTTDKYRAFIQGSWAEFGIAKSGYAAARCGWFSDRSLCYLASGRPVVAQETGMGPYLPTGTGLFTFETGDEVAAAVEELQRDYARHARAARELAETYFASDRVLRQLLERLGRR